MSLQPLVLRSIPVLACIVLGFAALGDSQASTSCVPELTLPSTATLTSTASGTVLTATLRNVGSGACPETYLSAYPSDGLRTTGSGASLDGTAAFWTIPGLSPDEERGIPVGITAQSGNGPWMLEMILNVGEAADEAAVAILDSVPTAIPRPTPAVSSAPSPATVSSLCAPVEEKGMWVWNSPRGMSSAWRLKILDAMRQGGFNMAYIDGTELATLSEQPEPRRTEDLQAFSDGLRAFVLDARERAIGVQVAFGYRSWSRPDERSKPLSIIDHVLQYDAAADAAARICGLQSDIEPYLLPEYEEEKAVILTEFVQTMDLLATRIRAVAPHLSFNVVIPHFYDPVQAWTPLVTYANKTQSTFEHLLDILRPSPASTVSVMAYRNFLDGSNGVMALASPEIEIASRSPNPRVVIAQEVGCGVDPLWISWCNATKRDLESAFSTLRSTFSPAAAFGGFAVNYIDPYIDLAE